MKWPALAALCVALLAPAVAWGECDVRLTAFSVSRAGYDPFVAVPASARATASVFSGESSACPVAVAIAPAAPSFVLNYGVDELQARVVGAFGPGPYGVERSVLAPPGASEIEFDLEIEAGQVVAPGAYSAVLTATIVNETGDAALTFDQRSALFEAEALSRAEVSLAPVGGWTGASAGVIDFGELAAGETGRVVVQVRANTYVQIEVSSSSASRLVRTGANGGDEAIPFTVTLDAVPLTIAAGVDHLTRQPAPTLAGSLYDLQVTVGQLSEIYAGDYRGTVEINVSSQ